MSQNEWKILEGIKKKIKIDHQLRKVLGGSNSNPWIKIIVLVFFILGAICLISANISDWDITICQVHNASFLLLLMHLMMYSQ